MHAKILEQKLLDMVKEDLGFYDITTEFVQDKKIKAEIIAKSKGVVSGIYELKILFQIFGIKAREHIRDGEKTTNNKKIFSLEGGSKDILMVERTALNILSRMSGITTLTDEFVVKTKKINPLIKIAATRKTTPLFGYFEKKAVRIGGGDTHRFNLSDAVLIKDNHLKLFKNIHDAIKTAKKNTSFTHKIEIEVSNLKDAVLAAKNNADIIMLDNMSVADVEKTIYELKKQGLREKVIIEVSGGINPENVEEYAASGADILSIGALTHSAPAMDFSLVVSG